MRPAIGRGAYVVLLAAAFAAGGCHKSAETEAAEAKQAASARIQKEQKAYCELQHGSSEAATEALIESQDANERAAREQRDVEVAIERERDRYSTLLRKEISWIERRANELEKDAKTAKGALKVEKDEDIAAARTWADRLREDLEDVEHLTPDADWSSVKTRIDSDLDENRPVSIPRTFEKSYGI